MPRLNLQRRSHNPAIPQQPAPTTGLERASFPYAASLGRGVWAPLATSRPAWAGGHLHVNPLMLGERGFFQQAVQAHGWRCGASERGEGYQVVGATPRRVLLARHCVRLAPQRTRNERATPWACTLYETVLVMTNIEGHSMP